MKDSDFCGAIVYHLGVKTRIKSIEENRIVLEEKKEDGKNYILVYPDSFFESEHGVFLKTKDKWLNNRIYKDSLGHICAKCGKYYYQILKNCYGSKGKMICEACLKKTCSHCHKNIELAYNRCDCAGNLLCQECYDERMSWKTIDFTKSRKYCKVKVCAKVPKEYANRVECVRARVAYFLNFRCSIHEIDFFYSEKDNVFICLSPIYKAMKEKYGNMLLYVTFDSDCYEYDWSNSYSGDLFYRPDSILSRWNYIAQEDKQSEAERRAIITHILYYNPKAKGEIEEHLNNMLLYRKDRCYNASRIWESDLQFMADNNFGESVIDLTEPLIDFCTKRGIKYELI